VGVRDRLAQGARAGVETARDRERGRGRRRIDTDRQQQADRRSAASGRKGFHFDSSSFVRAAGTALASRHKRFERQICANTAIGFRAATLTTDCWRIRQTNSAH
jgi:hypothetical protein